MQGSYSATLVALSLIIAMLASYTVLDLTAFISFLERPRVKQAWLAAGATAMGIGIWSMHFVGMLAFSLPIPMGYDLHITVASLALAIFASYFALNVIIRPQLELPRLLTGGVLIGLGIAGMHYAGMAAMKMSPGIVWRPGLVVLSVLIAIVAATAAMWIANALNAGSRRFIVIKRLGASAVMGLAITGMHYTGMAAAIFLPGAICGAAKGTSIDWLATVVALMTIAILMVTLVVSRFDARTVFMRRMAQTMDGQIRRRTGELHRNTHLAEAQEDPSYIAPLQVAPEPDAGEHAAAVHRLEAELQVQRKLMDDLQRNYAHLLQSARMASSGQLPGLICEELNQPLDAANTSLATLRSSAQRLLEGVNAQERLIEKFDTEARAHLLECWTDAAVAMARRDIPLLIEETQHALTRTRRVSDTLAELVVPVP